MLKVEDLKRKTNSELQDMAIQLRRELMNLRFQRVAGQITSTARFREARREIAQIKTLQRQNALSKALS
ncbi:50S ribosomal protein L29 [Candidatus Paracaedimonas acanthamoebae]|nr:50S ribosomal protein L29 [Candidatus Paracaedimonas acanthamoebae]